MPDWSAAQQQFLGLAQTCRELRAELLPVYRAKIPHQVCLQYLRPYTLDFFSVFARAHNGVVGKLIIDLHVDPLQPATNRAIDVERIPSIYSAANRERTNFEIRITDSTKDNPQAPEVIRDLESLFTFAHGSKWDHYLRDAIGKIRLGIHGDAFEFMTIWINKGFNEGLDTAEQMATFIEAVRSGSRSQGFAFWR